MTGFCTLPFLVAGRDVAARVGLDAPGHFAAAFGAEVAHRFLTPGFVWMFWLGAGMALGSWAGAHLRRLEARNGVTPDDLAGVRRLATRVRRSIRHPWLRAIGPDLTADLSRLNGLLTGVHGFPPLPGLDHGDADAMTRTSEYFRRVLPHLHPEHLEEARFSAERYLGQIAHQGET